ncbi:MAG: GIY-YIG nuclease family protein [Verrucomicrobiota bacterium]|nr:GIY-YIG nuclease family protein [Verrucomicrobiota bacterium]
MTAPQPFSLKIFVADGDPDGLRLIERSNWIGKAVVFPRAIYTRVRSRTEFQQTGVYLLVGPRINGDGDMIYIGEGDPVGPRLEGHYAKKDFWTHAVFFVAGPDQLNKAHVQYIEAQLVARALRSKRTPLDNLNKPAEPTLSEADRADMDVFLKNILGILPILNIHAFEQNPVADVQQLNNHLTCKGNGVVATGYDTPQGFIVHKGSFAVKDVVLSLSRYDGGVLSLRTELMMSGVLIQDVLGLQFTQDYLFNSPSQAAGVVLGRSSNGRIEWKDKTGKTLKQIQEAEALNHS